MAAPVDNIFERGFRFTPSPQEIVTYYLPRLIAGAPLHEAIRPVIHRTDVYACEPGVLASKFRPASSKTNDRFFFTTCKRQKAGKGSRGVRVAGPGSWSSQKTISILDGPGVKIGEITKLRYNKGGVSTDWLMEEYSCCLEEAGGGGSRRVLCRIYLSPRAAPDSSARQESAAVFAQPAPEPVIAPAVPKRPAPPVAESPCPVRMRGAIVPIPPVVQPGRSPAPAPPRPQQQAPLPTPSVARDCHIRQQAARRHCPPRPSVQAPPAACLSVPVTSPGLAYTEPPAAAEDDFADDVKDLEDIIPTDEAEEEETTASPEDDSTTTEADDGSTDQFASLLEEDFLVWKKKKRRRPTSWKKNFCRSVLRIYRRSSSSSRRDRATQEVWWG